jgi:glycosyltransferase 2 family protein
MKSKIIFFLRLLVSITLFLVFVTSIDIEQFTSLLARTNIYFILAAALIIICNRLLVYYRLKLLLSTKDITIRYPDIVKIYWMCDFGGIFLPGSIGTDVLKILNLRNYMSSTHKAASSVLMEVFIGAFSLILIAFFSLVFYDSNVLSRQFSNALFVAGLACIGGCLALLCFPRTTKKVLSSLLPSGNLFGHIADRIKQIIDAVLEFSKHKRILAITFGLCLMIHTLRVLMVYFVALSLGLDTSLHYFFIMVPLVLFATTIPISVSGFGVREGAFIYLMGMIGVSITDAFTLSVLSAAIPLSIKLIGGTIYIKEGFLITKRSE